MRAFCSAERWKYIVGSRLEMVVDWAWKRKGCKDLLGQCEKHFFVWYLDRVEQSGGFELEGLGRGGTRE